ncbi:MAG: amidohydrolase [Firmicutes bacterium]|nr:amidohydrolase [Bacillota bacterium]
MRIAAQQVFTGRKLLPNMSVHLQGAEIVGIGPGDEPGSGPALLMPGIIDSHVHLLGLGMSLTALNLKDCNSREAFSRALREYASGFAGQWIIGRGWDQNKLGFTPDRHFLDEICPQRPVCLTRVCGHVAAVNSRALELAGIDGNSADVPGGVIRRDATGQPTGILEEKAVALVQRAVPRPEPPVLYSALERAIKYAHRRGITGVHTDDRSIVGDYFRLWQLYVKVTESCPLRVQFHCQIDSLQALNEFIAVRGELRDTELVHIGAAKLFLDGSLGARTAALLEDYSDDPGNRGVLVYPDAEVRAVMATAEEKGVQLALHAIGDAAVEQALTLLAEVRGGYRRGRIRHCLIHCQVVSREQLARMAALGFIAEVQPGFLRTDMHWAKSRLGAERLQASYCWRTMADAGVFMTGGSDAPVEDINPWLGIDAAVLRRDGNGTYAGDWRRDESLTLEKALALYTAAGAEAAGWETGVIAGGKAADLAVYECFSAENLSANSPAQVFVNGIKVYQR